MTSFPGTDGYAAEAPTLVERYERRSFEEVHDAILHLVPAGGAYVLDIGAGTGRDAAALAGRGNRVLAVEPTTELRVPAALRHPSPAISWIDDGLPALAAVHARGERFDFVLATAVWMHLDEGERARAFGAVAGLIAPGGHWSVTLRRGPVPAGRRMFHVPAAEMAAQAAEAGLTVVMNRKEPSIGAENLASGVWWRRLVFKRA
ncbi:bifunctional 2-polyprenyl-6-hydroxyphenol methylase/3-demethylubiquinol 3-O-methyltransferase UbiG [Sphingomonas sp.]|uniref:class I SAM-dependent methyltransferase n=1 Tax=Sphingomonas sp. TaxID=28214 RepID=UPI001E1A8D7C|nr:class I SAM-dependent methyltransferase [Sphingomonas sp.]MBX9797320.1 class I SAM-dependent methyltransferase [Sphingomonas sp.]